MRTLARSHSICMLIEEDHTLSMGEVSQKEMVKIRSPITEA